MTFDIAFDSYTITATSVGPGSISPNGTIAVTDGSNQTFTFTPDAGAIISQVLIDGVNNASAVIAGSYTFSTISANHSIQVIFDYPAATLPYSPTLASNDGWIILNGTQMNKWIIGNTTSGTYNVTNGLYISNDNGVTNAYEAAATGCTSMVYAIRKINFDQTGTIQISYKWRNKGGLEYDYLRAFLVPENVELVAGSDAGIGTSNTPSGWIALDGGGQLVNSTIWNDRNFTTEISAGIYKLVFYWKNDYSVGTPPPAAIKDIIIKKLEPHTVTFNAGTGTCLIGSLTENSTGAGITLPSATPSASCEDWEFAGWATYSVDSTTTIPTLYAAGTSYHPTSNETLYAVYRTSGNSEYLLETVTFEADQGFTAGTTYNNTTPNIQGTKPWAFLHGTPSTTDAIDGSQSAQMRSYTSDSNFGSITMQFDNPHITKIKFNTKTNSGTNDSFYVAYSNNQGNTWNYLNVSINNTKTQKTFDISSTGEYPFVRIKFENRLINTENRVYIDNVEFYAMEHIFATSPNCCIDDITEINATICLGETYNENGFNITPTVSGLTTDNLTLTATNGCDSVVILNLTVNSLPTAGITNNTSDTELSCFTTNISVTATGGTTYAWSGGSSTNTAANTFNTAGTYTVTVTAENGCTDTESITITQSADLPIVSISPSITELSCTNPTATLTASGTGTSYLWSNGATTAIITVSSAGTYTVTATAANGCTNTASQGITENKTTPTAGITNNDATTILTCTKTSISVTATGGTTYAWSGGSSTNTATNTFNTAGTYTVTVTATNGCTDTESITITENKIVPTVNISANRTILTCTNSTATLTASGTGTSYLWSNGATTAAITVSSAGTYTVTATAANGCTNTASQGITENKTTKYSELTVSSCDTYSYGTASVEGQKTYTVSGNYTHTFVAKSNGCDSIVTLKLTINNSYNTPISATICTGESYTDNGFNIINPPVGSAIFNLQLSTINGCDSTVTLTLNVKGYYNEINREIIDGDSLLWRGHYFKTGGVFYDSLKTVDLGCDSVYAVNITIVHPPANFCGSVYDVDGNLYIGVEINGICWFSTNLKTTKDSLGNAITVLAYTGVGNNEAFGLYYDFETAQKVCPQGWRLPTPQEWNSLRSYEIADLKLAGNLWWLGQPATNGTGLSLVPGGLYRNDMSRFELVRSDAFYWSYDPTDPSIARASWCNHSCFDPNLSVIAIPQQDALSVKCVKK
jgi:uncharacterized protein (TIGR02145 family)